MKQAHVIISGFVQGVGFRYFIKNKAGELNLNGWIRNTADNKVEAVFQSSMSSDQEGKKQIEELISLCKKGPFLSEVKNVEIEWQEKQQLEKMPEGFEIIDSNYK